MVVSKGSTPLQALGYYIPFITSFINNMRKIEREMIQAIMDRKSFNKANTSVSIGYAGTMLDHYKDAYMTIKLHGNEIAKYYYNKDNTPLCINHCGWMTNTTKSRLNALITFVRGGCYGIYQKNFQWFYRTPDCDPMPLDVFDSWFCC